MTRGYGGDYGLSAPPIPIRASQPSTTVTMNKVSFFYLFSGNVERSGKITKLVKYT